MSDYSQAAASAAASINNTMVNLTNSKRQNKRAIEFWNTQNEYNHPRQQMQRLQEAGLNPNLVYGGGVSGASGRADSIGTPDKPDLSSAAKPLTEFIQMKAQRAQADLLQQQVQTEKEKTRLTKIQGDKTFYDAANANTADPLNEKHILDMEAQRVATENMRIKNAISREDLWILHNTGDEQIQRKIDEALRARHEASNAEKLGKLRDLEIDLKNKNIDYYDTNQVLDIIGKLLGLKNK